MHKLYIIFCRSYKYENSQLNAREKLKDLNSLWVAFTYQRPIQKAIQLIYYFTILSSAKNTCSDYSFSRIASSPFFH